MAMVFSPSVSLPFFSRRPCCSTSHKCCPFISPRSKATKGIETLFALATTTRRRRKSIITIRSTGVNASLGSSAEAGRLESFWRWLCERGVVSEDSPLVKPGVVREGLGLVAQRNISQNEVVVKVPRKLWINPDTVAASQIGSVCSGLKPWISVALFLVREKAREDSPWRTYFGILPDSTNSTIFWSEEELSEIQGTQLLSTTLGVKDYVKSEFLKVKEQVIAPHSHLFPSITLDDFLWAFGILRSRAFSRLRGESLVLIPFADLINHGSSIISEDVAWEIKGTGLFSKELVFSLRTPLAVKAGEQDEELMDAGTLDPKLEIAVRIRAGEKKVLHQIDRIFKEREMELDSLEYYQERRLKELGLVGEQGEIIFWE
eukprot:TRINITY_DN8966_c0_g1_i1.p1 TRINITY_DN8966_c0_g1~~TRINITY_DN8966_c0_g1_i1.p1  ORF type:complete len:375 (-),score=67.48 TRINITY_DN8966_c0_g1_i1:335-1459(-)